MAPSPSQPLPRWALADGEHADDALASEPLLDFLGSADEERAARRLGLAEAPCTRGDYGPVIRRSRDIEAKIALSRKVAANCIPSAPRLSFTFTPLIHTLT